MAEAGDRAVFAASAVTIGEFRCPPSSPAWARENRIDDVYLVVFPRVPVRIAQAGREPVVADANRVMFYNPEQTYTRELLCERGDECEWFAVGAEVLLDAVAAIDPSVTERPEAAFPFSSGPGSARSYLTQRWIYEHTRRTEVPDALTVEEAFLTVLADVLVSAFATRGVRPRTHHPKTSAAHREHVEAVQALLAARLGENLSLSAIAAAVHLSPFHLCRIFRRHAGIPLQRYRNELRLRAALERIHDTRDRDLTGIALDLGFNSHAHFTAAFRRTFGLPPSHVRRVGDTRLLRHLSKHLKVPPLRVA